MTKRHGLVAMLLALLAGVSVTAQAPSSGYAVDLLFFDPGAVIQTAMPHGTVRVSLTPPYNPYLLACDLRPFGWAPAKGSPSIGAHVFTDLRPVEPYVIVEFIDVGTGRACRMQVGAPPWPFTLALAFSFNGGATGGRIVPVAGTFTPDPPAMPVHVTPKGSI